MYINFEAAFFNFGYISHAIVGVCLTFLLVFRFHFPVSMDVLEFCNVINSSQVLHRLTSHILNRCQPSNHNNTRWFSNSPPPHPPAHVGKKLYIVEVDVLFLTFVSGGQKINNVSVCNISALVPNRDTFQTTWPREPFSTKKQFFPVELWVWVQISWEPRCALLSCQQFVLHSGGISLESNYKRSDKDGSQMVVEWWAKFTHTAPQHGKVCDWINKCSDLTSKECL